MPARATTPTRGSRRKYAGSGSKARSVRPPAERAKRFVIQLKRAYDPPSPRDGARVLVDRVWPRGMTRHKDENRCLAPRSRAEHGTAQVVWP
ncbi:MAG TPA: DUF488 family protein [bacterium]|nr:DUF488 family protein [bacterium]